jgi:hypothetical protein
MKKSSFLCVLMAVALLSGCSKSEFVGPAGIEAGQIALRSSITDVNASLTRAAYEGTISKENQLTAFVLTTLTSQDYTESATKLYATGTMTFSSEATDAITAYNTPLIYGTSTRYSGYPGNEEVNHYLTGLYPAEGWEVNNGEATLPLTGKEDVMLAPQVSTTYKAAYGQNTYPLLAFRHKLTQLKLATKKTAALSSDNITLVRAKVISAENGLSGTATAKLSQSTQAVALSGPVDSIPFYTLEDDVKAINQTIPETTAETVAYTLVDPVTIDNAVDDYTLAITYINEKGTPVIDRKVAVTLPTNPQNSGDLTTGYSYLITLTFDSGNIVARATVTAWKNGGTFSQNF